MKTSFSRAIPVLLAVLTTTWTVPVCGQFPELLQLIPDEANTLVVLNVEQIFASPVAVREGWKQNYEKAFAAAPLLLPPTAQQFVLASKLGLEFIRPEWEVAAMKLSKDPSVERIAKRIRGTVDRIGDTPAVQGPLGGFIVKFAPNTVGMISKTDRQNAAKWVSDAKARTAVEISPYLKKAAGYAQDVGTEIIMAVDLHDVVRVADVRAAMGRSAVLKDKKIDLDKLSALLTSIQGVTLGVTVHEKTFGALKVDFAGEASILSEIGKPLLLEILAEAGATIDEFEDWQEEVTSKQLLIKGDLTDSGMRRLFSVLEMDASTVAEEPTGQEEAPPETPAGSAEETKAYVSRQYFQGVNKYLKDLQVRKGAKSFGQYGLWFENYARKIDKMPILNVDPDLVDYGQTVSNRLRDAVTAIQGAGIRTGAREAQVYNQGYVRGYSSGWRAYGGSSYVEASFNNVQGERRAIRAEERAQGAASARDIMKQITLDTNTVRRTMTERYQIEF